MQFLELPALFFRHGSMGMPLDGEVAGTRGMLKS